MGGTVFALHALGHGFDPQCYKGKSQQGHESQPVKAFFQIKRTEATRQAIWDPDWILDQTKPHTHLKNHFWWAGTFGTVLAAKPNGLSSSPGIHVVEVDLIPTSCPLTSVGVFPASRRANKRNKKKSVNFFWLILLDS